MRDRTRRLGIQAVMQLAEQRFHEQAERNLSAGRVSEMKSASGSSLFVAGRYPPPEWEAIVGFAPDADFHYEVTIGIAVEPGEAPNLLAKLLISRDVEENFCSIQWGPSQSGA